MQGTGTLTVFAGQTITLSGAGALSANNVAAVLLGGATLYTRGATAGSSAALSGAGDLLVTASVPTTGMVWTPPAASIGGDREYAVGRASLSALFSSGTGGLYAPPTPTTGYGNLPGIVSSGFVMDIDIGNGDAVLPAWSSLGGDHEYGAARDQFLQPMWSAGAYGEPLSTSVFSVVHAGSVSEMVSDMVIILTSEGTLAASFTADRIAVTQFLSDITGESSFASTAELLTSLISSGGFTDSLSAAVGDRAAVDGQVWVVNLATEASSQYDDFGFNSFFTHEGRHYGVASDGIYLLEGATDNGEVIESMVDFGINDCGLPHRKKITNVRIGTTDGADTVLEVTTDTGTREYKLERSKEGDFFWRARMPHVQQGVYWRFVLKSSTQFELNSIDFAPANLTRRF